MEGPFNETHPQNYGVGLVSFVLGIAANLNSRKAVRLRLCRKKTTLPSRFLRSVISVLSSPKGDQGGWEGGARGL
jgi:hypothetical protein